MNIKIKDRVFLLFILFLVIFALSCYKKNNFGKLPRDNAHTWLTGSSVKFIENWLEDGALNLDFRMYEYPKSIETPELKDRGLYVSYPVGCILPIYAVVKSYSILKNNSITATGIIKIIQWYSLVTHAIEALCLFLICWLYLRKKVDSVVAIIVSFFSIFLLYSFNFSNYYHFYVYFADQGVLWIYSLSVLFELLKHGIQSKKKRFIIEVLLFVINLLGLATDWFFCFYMFVVFIKRLIFHEFGQFNKKNTYLKISFYCLPVFMVLAIFLYQIISVDTISSLISKLRFRTNDTTTYSGFWLVAVLKHFICGYGIVTTLIFSLSIIFFCYRMIVSIRNRQSDMFVYFYSILLIPCIFQVSFFRNHSAIHEFSVLKFELAISFFLVVCLFEIISDFSAYSLNLNCTINHKENCVRIPLIIFFVAFIALFSVFSQTHIYTVGVDTNYDKEYFIKNNTDFNDVIFSFDYEIPINPPHNLAHSRKIVRKIELLDEIADFINQHDLSTARCLIFVSNNNFRDELKNFNKIVEENGMSLYEYRIEP